MTIKNKISISKNDLNENILPNHTAIIPGTRFVMAQSDGGSIFLGPILGSMNISSKTKALANSSKKSYFNIDVRHDVKNALRRLPEYTESKKSSLKVEPFVYVEKGYDNILRSSLVLHVSGSIESKPWVGRYFYHLSQLIHIDNLGAATSKQINDYHQEIKIAATELKKIIAKDIDGKLPKEGRKATIASLNLISLKLGSMGIYTMPEERSIISRVISDKNDQVVLRLDGVMDSTPVFGAMAFGLHVFQKSQLLKFAYIETNSNARS